MENKLKDKRTWDDEEEYYPSHCQHCHHQLCKKCHKCIVCKQCCCPPGSCQCPPGSCTCPPDSCQCPPGSCTCPPDSCQCPPGSCTCPEGTCPQSGELVQNPSFETPCPDSGPGTPCNVFAYWQGTNIDDDDDALTGNVAALLGDNTSLNATLEQTVCGINPGCYYEFTFSVNAQNLSGNGEFTAQVFWVDNDTMPPTQTPATESIVIDASFSGNTYVFIKRITNLAPAGTDCARILFTKTGTGSVLIDDVSFASL